MPILITVLRPSHSGYKHTSFHIVLDIIKTYINLVLCDLKTEPELAPLAVLLTARQTFMNTIAPAPDSREVNQDLELDHLVRGTGIYADDVRLETPLHAAFLRSPYASARLGHWDVPEMGKITAIHTGADVRHLGRLSINAVLALSDIPEFPILAVERVEAVGQPVAAVLSECRVAAQDAIEEILVEFEEEEPTASMPIATGEWRTEGVEQAFAAADHVVECAIAHPRLAPNPMEPRTIAVRYEPSDDSVTIWQSTQTPHRTRSELSRILGVALEKIRVIAPQVGGAFGMKASVYPEEVYAVWAAFHLKRNIKWTATRSDEFLSATHGRGIKTRGRLAMDANGRFLALTANVEAPLGHWIPNSGLIPAWNAARILPGGYAVKEVAINTCARMDNRTATGIYRGAGRPEANCLMERLVDQAAVKSGLTPVEIRRRNFLPAVGFPHVTPTENTLDSGNYEGLLGLLIDTADYAGEIRERDRRRQRSECVGVGLAFYLEPSGSGFESAEVTAFPDGRFEIASGSSSQGHNRDSAYRKIAAEALQVAPDAIDVRYGDTGTCPEGIGAVASRSTAIGGSAVLEACRKVRVRIAAGDPMPISETVRYENSGQAWGYGCCLVRMSVCMDTGNPLLERMVCVDDTGTIIDHDLVQGQVIGGLAQGIGEALMEELIYSEDGQLLTGSLMDYCLPRASDMPPITLATMETPSPTNLLGAKGVGEAGTIAAPAAILNAAHDALRPFGVTDLAMPLTANTLWTALHTAQQG